MKHPKRELVGDALGLVALCWVLFHLIVIAAAGDSIIVIEPNPVILWTELILTALAALLLAERFRDDSGRR